MAADYDFFGVFRFDRPGDSALDTPWDVLREIFDANVDRRRGGVVVSEHPVLHERVSAGNDTLHLIDILHFNDALDREAVYF